MSFNHARIASLEARITETKAGIVRIGERAKAGGRLLTATENREITKAREDLQTYSLRLQHERSLAGAWGPRPY